MCIYNILHDLISGMRHSLLPPTEINSIFFLFELQQPVYHALCLEVKAHKLFQWIIITCKTESNQYTNIQLININKYLIS